MYPMKILVYLVASRNGACSPHDDVWHSLWYPFLVWILTMIVCFMIICLYLGMGHVPDDDIGIFCYELMCVHIWMKHWVFLRWYISTNGIFVILMMIYAYYIDFILALDCYIIYGEMLRISPWIGFLVLLW